jgi:hypothetical protein
MVRISGLSIIIFFTLAHAAFAQQPAGDEVRVVFVRDGVFRSPADRGWDEIPESTHSLQAQVITVPHGGGSVSKVSVRATHDGEEIAFRLSWSDSTADRGVGVDTFRDAVAIGFPVGRPNITPSPFMGDEEHPVVIWQWAADFDADAEGRSRFSHRYPRLEGVWIFPQDLSVKRKVKGWRGADPVIEYVAKGFGTLAPRMGTSVGGISDYTSGEWSVVLRRKLRSANVVDPVFEPGTLSSLILAVWNGEKADVNGRKAVTYQWIPARLDSISRPTAMADAGVDGAE